MRNHSIFVGIIISLVLAAFSISAHAQFNPVIDFSASPTCGSPPLKVKFTDASTPTPTKWIWDFGDGTVEETILLMIYHAYEKEGIYDVQLTVEYGEGETHTITKIGYIKVESLITDFSVASSSGNIREKYVIGSTPLTVNFQDLSMGCPNRWFWSFGDGYTSTEQNPSHTYEREGNYNVSLTAYDPSNKRERKIKSDYILVTPPFCLATQLASQGYPWENIPLEKGWNLISFRMLPQYNGAYADTIPDVLCSIEGYYVMVQTFHNLDNIAQWPNPNIPDYPDRDDRIYEDSARAPGLKSFMPTRLQNNLWHLDPYHGYLIKVTAPVTLTLASDGTVPTLGPDGTMTMGRSEAIVNTPIVLHKGLNLIGYLPKEDDSIRHAFSSIDGKYMWVHSYFNGEGPKTWDANRPDFLNDLRNLKPHYGYWIRIRNDVERAELVYPIEGYAPIFSPPIPVPVDISPTFYFCDFWSVATTLDGQPVQIGDVITAKDPEGIICGVCTVEREGAYLMHVYGDDLTTPNEDEGADEGDVITFYINERPVATGGEPLWWSSGRSTKLDLRAQFIPVIDFSASLTCGSPPLKVKFTDASTDNLKITKRIWNFGDGTVKETTLLMIYHTYEKAGTYDVKLTVEYGDGETHTITKTGYIKVESLVADFSVASSSGDIKDKHVIGYKPLTVHFRDLSAGCPNRWTWSFGDGYNSEECSGQIGCCTPI